MILPALTEATSPFWRPIKYSLFPPLGLATLAAYLGELTPRSRFRTSTSRRSTSTTHRTSSSFRSTSPRRTAPIASRITTVVSGAYVALGGLHVTSLPDEAAAHADTIFLGPGEDTWPRFLADFRHGGPKRVYRSTHPDAGRPSADSARSDQATALSRAELHRRVARLPARLRLLLQGGVLRRRTLVLHADRRCGAGRDRSPAGPPPVLPRRSSVRRSPVRVGALRRHARHGTSLAGCRER